MNIAFDYDDTITLDRPFWLNIIKSTLVRGHRAFIVSCRTDNIENLTSIRDWLGDIGEKVPIVLTNHTSKQEAVKLHNYKIDVWVENNIGTILYGE